jgi:hypothetical protein
MKIMTSKKLILSVLFIACSIMLISSCALRDCKGHKKHRLSNGVII